jgi:hypothetical protein
LPSSARKQHPIHVDILDFERTIAKAYRGKLKMELRSLSLFSYELDALLEALRRDLRSERCKAVTDSQESEFHLSNYRSTIKILETLNPKSVKPTKTGAAVQSASQLG